MKKKNYIVGTLVAGTAVTLATVGASTVAADTDQVVNVETGGVTTVENATQVPVESSSTSETAITATDVQTAGEAVKQAQSAVDAQQVVVETATQAYGTAEQVAAQVNEQLTIAEETVAQATPEAIQKAEAAVEQAKASQVTRESSIQPANDSVNQAQAEVDTQVKVVDTATQVTSKKQADVDAAQKNVNNAQAILDGTGAQAVYDAQEKAQEIVNKDKVNVDDAQVKLEVAQEADKKRQNAIDEAQKLADDSAKTLSDKTTELSNAKTNYDQVNADLVTKQLTFEKAENDYNGLQHFVVTPDYVQALKDFVNNPYSILSEREKWDEWHEDAKTRLKAANQANVEANLKYSINLNDDNTTEYDVNNLPKDLQTELSHYASYLLNQIRTIFGTPLTAVTSSSVDFVDQSTDKSVSKNWDTWNSSHDEESIWSTAVEYGLTDKNYSVGNYHENWSGAFFYDRDYDSDGYISISGREKVTKQTLKRAVHQAVIGFMFNGYEWLHAQSISGLTDKSTEYVSGQGYVEKYDDVVYLGIDFTKVNGNAGVHFITVGTHDLTSESTFNTVSIDNPYNIEKITKQYQATLKVRDEVKLQVDQASLNLENAQKEYAIALENDKVAKATLANAQSIAVQTPAALEELNKFQTILDASQKVLDQANVNVLTLESDIKEKKANLEAAQNELAMQQSELSVAKDNQAKEEAKLARLEGALAQALEKRKQAQSDLDQAKKAVLDAEQALLDLQTAQEKLENAQVLYADAQQKLADAKEKLDTERSILEELQAALNAKQVYYNELYAKFEAAQAIVKDLEEKAKDNVIVTLPDGTVIAIPKDAPTTPEKPVLDIELVKDAVAKGQDVKVVDGKVVVDEKKVPVVLPTTVKPQVIQSANQVSTSKKVSFTSSETAQTLPNTGSKESTLLVSVGAVLGGLGLAGARRRKQG
ncbi:TPA: SEC10/PgrA surface exclusion domain-containing protein [Streptococcus suis]